MERDKVNFWLPQIDIETAKAYQERTGTSMSEQWRQAIRNWSLYDPVVSGQRIKGLFAETESGMVQLGWIKA